MFVTLSLCRRDVIISVNIFHDPSDPVSALISASTL